MAGLSGIGLSASTDGNVYLLGGNVVAQQDAAGGDATVTDPQANDPMMSNPMMYMYGPMYGYSPMTPTSSCDTTSTSATTSATTYDYANFYKFDPSAEPIAMTALTVTSSDADNLCPPNSDVCREYFGPAPSTSFNIASQAATGWLIAASSPLCSVHSLDNAVESQCACFDGKPGPAAAATATPTNERISGGAVDESSELQSNRSTRNQTMLMKLH